MRSAALVLISTLTLSGCIATGAGAFASGYADGRAGRAAPPQVATASATHTGRFRYGTSVTGVAVIECEYRYGSTTFVRTFPAGACPISVPVQ